jgi:DNA-binding IscR family transcriptional regulator
MLIPKTVETALEIFEIIERADVEWVPSDAIRKFCTAPDDCVWTILNRLVKAGILESKRGPAGGYRVGGYRHGHITSLHELMRVITPSRIKHNPSCNDKVNRVQRRILELYLSVKFVPKALQITPATTDGHEPTEGLPLTQENDHVSPQQDPQ